MVQREGTNSVRSKDQVNHEEQIENHFSSTIWSWIVSCYCQVSDTSVLWTTILLTSSLFFLSLFPSLPLSFILSPSLRLSISISLFFSSLFLSSFLMFGVTIVTTSTLSDPKLLINNDWTPLHIIFFPLSSYRKETGSSPESFFFQIDLEGKHPSFSFSLSLLLFSLSFSLTLFSFLSFLFFSFPFSFLTLPFFSFILYSLYPFFLFLYYSLSWFLLHTLQQKSDKGKWSLLASVISCSLLSISLETSL